MMQRGAITLVFDDGYEQIFTTVIPFLSQRKIKGVFAIPLNHDIVEQTEGQPTTSWEQWIKISENGHEIAAHSVSHSSLPGLPEEALEQELREPAEKLGATTLVYPGGAHNERVVQSASVYYKAARTVRKGFENMTPENPMQLKCYNFTRNNFSTWKANALAVWAWVTNKWLIETYHMIDHPTAVHSVPFNDFKKHISFIQRLPIPIQTIRERTML